jgi:hypothetical protein
MLQLAAVLGHAREWKKSKRLSVEVRSLRDDVKPASGWSAAVLGEACYHLGEFEEAWPMLDEAVKFETEISEKLRLLRMLCIACARAGLSDRSIIAGEQAMATYRSKTKLG